MNSYIYRKGKNHQTLHITFKKKEILFFFHKKLPSIDSDPDWYDIIQKVQLLKVKRNKIGPTRIKKEGTLQLNENQFHTLLTFIGNNEKNQKYELPTRTVCSLYVSKKPFSVEIQFKLHYSSSNLKELTVSFSNELTHDEEKCLIIEEQTFLPTDFFNK